MDKIYITAASQASPGDARAAQFGARFGRLDLASQLALMAVESLGIDFDELPRERVGICLASRDGSLAADCEYWRGRGAAGGPSPALFVYTLPSAAIGELAIRHRLTGPSLCLVGPGSVLTEAADWLRRGEVEACLCVECRVITPALGEMIGSPPDAAAFALFLRRGGWRALEENERDMERLCAAFSAHTAAS
ncbi:MAG TPA: beta-ketoacyl synthase N-terminal-like domain-containing protein [Verrucomicrobiae bacterium]|jgi:3-oxoacyl-(acyl-carrier-protein) synthase